jgi:hypothetical protein
MNKPLLRSVMARYGDTQDSLAAAMGISLSRFNAKVNERNGAAFTQSEMSFIIERYHLTSDEAMDIFFTQKVS